MAHEVLMRCELCPIVVNYLLQNSNFYDIILSALYESYYGLPSAGQERRIDWEEL